MGVAPFLILILAALKQESTADFSQNTTGVKFVVAFPENIAYYHPTIPRNKIQVTALYGNTVVTIKTRVYRRDTRPLRMGETHVFNVDVRMELNRSHISSNIIQVTSTKTITVHAISQKHNSIQTALVVSVNKLGTKYHIPPAPRIKGTVEPMASVATNVTDRVPFKLIIINASENNTVTLEGAEKKEVSLGPEQLIQFWLRESEATRGVKAEQPVAVLFGHPCAVVVNCTCSMLFTTLLPARDDDRNFLIPPVLTKDVESETVVLLSDTTSTRLVPFNPDSSLVKSSSSVVLHRPGMLLSLIPEEDFASCYVLHSITDIESYAVLVVQENQTPGVHVGRLPLQNPDWQEITGTEFVSMHVALTTGRNVIWHNSSKMAVYLMGKNGAALFGNPAPVVSKLTEVMEMGTVAMGWAESVQYCRDQNLQLVCLNRAGLREHVSTKLNQARNASLERVWIGLRRSSLTGEWYWVSRAPVTDTNWDRGEPGTAQDGQCAVMSLDSEKDFVWSDADCCMTARPLCYSRPILFPL